MASFSSLSVCTSPSSASWSSSSSASLLRWFSGWVITPAPAAALPAPLLCADHDARRSSSPAPRSLSSAIAALLDAKPADPSQPSPAHAHESQQSCGAAGIDPCGLAIDTAELGVDTTCARSSSWPSLDSMRGSPAEPSSSSSSSRCASPMSLTSAVAWLQQPHPQWHSGRPERRAVHGGRRVGAVVYDAHSAAAIPELELPPAVTCMSSSSSSDESDAERVCMVSRSVSWPSSPASLDIETAPTLLWLRSTSASSSASSSPSASPASSLLTSPASSPPQRYHIKAFLA